MACRQSSSDPLLREIFDRYDLQLLEAPNDLTGAGQVYSLRDGDPKLHREGSLDAYFTGGSVLPPTATGTMANLALVSSGQIDLQAGLSALDGALGALAAKVGFTGDLRGALAAQDVAKVQFRVTDVTLDAIAPRALDDALAGRRVPDRVALLPNTSLFVAVGAAKSASIALSAFTNKGASAHLDLSKLQIASAKTAVTLSSTSDNTVEFHGTKPLTFALELRELRLVPATRSFYTVPVPNPMRMSTLAVTPTPHHRLRAPDAPAFIAVG